MAYPVVDRAGIVRHVATQARRDHLIARRGWTPFVAKALDEKPPAKKTTRTSRTADKE